MVICASDVPDMRQNADASLAPALVVRAYAPAADATHVIPLSRVRVARLAG